MKKRLFTLLLAVCLCMLAGCHAADPENRFHLTEPPETQAPGVTVTEGETSPQPTVSADLPPDIDPTYNYGNMQTNIPGGNFVLCDGGILIENTWGGKSHTYFYDLAAGELQLGCKDATCSHFSMNCIIGGNWGNLEGCQGEIYTRSSTGALLKMKDWKWEEVLDGGVGVFCHRGEDTYVVSSDMSLLAYENGSTKPRTLIEEFPYHECVVIGKYLYARDYGLGQVVRVDVTAKQPELEVILKNGCGRTDGSHIYYSNFADDHTFYRCDMNGENPVKLTDCEVMADNFDNEYVYFRYAKGDTIGEDGHDLYRFPKSDPSKIEKIATLPEYIYRVYTVPGAKLLFVHVWPEGGWDQEKPTMIYVMDQDGSNARLLSFPDA